MKVSVKRNFFPALLSVMVTIRETKTKQEYGDRNRKMGVGLNHEGNACTSKVLLDFAFLLEWDSHRALLRIDRGLNPELYLQFT